MEPSVLTWSLHAVTFQGSAISLLPSFQFTGGPNSANPGRRSQSTQHSRQTPTTQPNLCSSFISSYSFLPFPNTTRNPTKSSPHPYFTDLFPASSKSHLPCPPTPISDSPWPQSIPHLPSPLSSPHFPHTLIPSSPGPCCELRGIRLIGFCLSLEFFFIPAVLIWIKSSILWGEARQGVNKHICSNKKKTWENEQMMNREGKGEEG